VRNGIGWRSFAAELCLVVNFFQLSFATYLSLGEGKSKPLPMLTSRQGEANCIVVEVFGNLLFVKG